MLNNISWGSYWTAVIIIICIYYIIICLKFYQVQLKEIIAGTSNRIFRNNDQETVKHKGIIDNGSTKNVTAPTDGEINVPPNISQVINNLKWQISTSLKDADKAQLIKQETMYSLKVVLQNYPAIKNTTLEPFINDYILTESNKHSSIQLDEKDIVQLWKE